MANETSVDALLQAAQFLEAASDGLGQGETQRGGQSVMQGGGQDGTQGRLPEGYLEATPNLRDLLSVLELFSAKWYDLGLRLGMKGYLLENIKSEERDSVKTSCRAMFQKWLNKGRGTGEAERTWMTVLEEVECVYDPDLRQEVERELLKQ